MRWDIFSAVIKIPREQDRIENWISWCASAVTLISGPDPWFLALPIPCSDDLLWWNPWTFHHVSTSLHPKTCDVSEILPEFMHHHKHANDVAISWSLIQHTWQQVWINLTGGTVSTLICISTLHCVDHVIVIIEGLRLIYWHGLTKRTSSVKFWFCTFEGKSSRLYVLYIYIPVTP